MTLEDATKRFAISKDILSKYVSYGFIEEHKAGEYSELDFEYLGLIDTLINAGFAEEELKKYLLLLKKEGTEKEQVYMLKRQRNILLDNIHKKQKFLDNLDYMIWLKEKEEEKKS